MVDKPGTILTTALEAVALGVYQEVQLHSNSRMKRQHFFTCTKLYTPWRHWTYGQTPSKWFICWTPGGTDCLHSLWISCSSSLETWEEGLTICLCLYEYMCVLSRRMLLSIDNYHQWCITMHTKQFNLMRFSVIFCSLMLKRYYKRFSRRARRLYVIYAIM